MGKGEKKPREKNLGIYYYCFFNFKKNKFNDVRNISKGLELIDVKKKVGNEKKKNEQEVLFYLNCR